MRTKNYEEEAGLVLRYDMETQKPVGATIADYKEHWLPSEGILIGSLSNFFGISFEDTGHIIQSAR